MTLTQTSATKVSEPPKGSKIAYSKLPKKNPKMVLTIEDNDGNGNKIVLQKPTTNPETAVRYSWLVLYACILMLVLLMGFQLVYLTQCRQHVDVLKIEIKDGASGDKVVKVEDSQSTTNGTRVLVYDGKQKYVTWPDPPNKDDFPSVARYVMHISEFGSLATNSTHKGIEGYPFVNVFSISDGPFDKSTGIPYFYFTPLELSVIDMKANNKVSLTITEAQSDYCNKNGFDPEDPRCAHVIFTGIMTQIVNGTEEEEFARNALFSRHVEMSSWPTGHSWFFAKMEIQHIYLLDFFGGAEVVDVKEYFASNPFKQVKKD